MDPTEHEPLDHPDLQQETLGKGRFRLLNNVVSLIGLFLTSITLILLTTFALFSAITPNPNPYVDIIGYLILPGLFIGGLLIIPIGMLLKARSLRRDPRGRVFRLPEIDLNKKSHGRLVLAFITLNLVVILPVIGVSSYQGYHYTDSTEFCAKVCHSVMEPEGTTHQVSPHAKVSCAECHIGAGADWFVKAKISGIRQVLAVWQDTYRRPIPAAITELRPARDTCEECHWPEKFFGSQLKEVVHFASDEHNTRREVRIVLKTGGADESIGRVEGIHMHMALEGATEYVALDEHLQQIPWVKHTNASGEVAVYRSDGMTGDDPPPKGTHRRLDCMDCHNRGAHHFKSPQKAIDLQMEAGRIDRSLPFIKRESVAALVKDYTDADNVDEEIADSLTRFYETHYPEMSNTQAEDIRRAIECVQEAYRRNFFPLMKVDWQTYPENIGHMESPGCFRCHDGLHVDGAGRSISSDCNVCHTFLNATEEPNQFREGVFQHSMDLQLHKNLRCNQCHTGGELPSCRGCHEKMGGLTYWDGESKFKSKDNKEP